MSMPLEENNSLHYIILFCPSKEKIDTSSSFMAHCVISSVIIIKSTLCCP